MAEPAGKAEPMLRILSRTFRELCTREGAIIWSVVILLLVCGPKGIPIFIPLFHNWIGNDPSQAGFRLQLISILSGFVLLGIIPMLMIRFVFKQSFREYGLGLGNVRLGMKMFLIIAVIWFPLTYFSARRPELSREYPLIYQGLSSAQIKAVFRWRTFIAFELLYSLFFFTVEFIYRGYMLLGLEKRFGNYAVLIQMIPYTLWHLPKPTTELLATPPWGFAVGALGLRIRSMWYAFAVHWLANVIMDILILHHRGVI